MNKEEISIYNYVGQTPFIQVPENLVLFLEGDCIAAVLLSKLISLYKYYSTKSLLKDGWFFLKGRDIEERLGINLYKQRMAFNCLESHSLIDMKLSGTPPCKHFRLNIPNIYALSTGDIVTIPLLPPIKEHNVTSKASYYEKLNEALGNGTLQSIKTSLDNLPWDIGEFLFAWTRIHKVIIGTDWIWTPRLLGTLNAYWKVVYRRKRPFDFIRIVEYIHDMKEQVITISKFIEFDKTKLESTTTPVSLKALMNSEEGQQYFKGGIDE